MESSRDRTSCESDDDPLPASEGEALSSPSPLPDPAPTGRKRRRHPLATKKGALFMGVALLIVVSLGVRLLTPYTGPRPTWSFQASADATIDVLPVAANGMVYVIS